MVSKQPHSTFQEPSSCQKVKKSGLQPMQSSTLSGPHFVLRSIAAVYTGNPTQAATLHRLFESADGRILSEDSLARIAQRICESWEPAQLSSDRLLAFIRFLKFILAHTSIPGVTYGLEEAIKICAHRHSAFPTVHVPLVLLLALGYLERLTMRYRNAKGEPGCAQRLFLMAYTIAAKYLHANLAASTPLLRNRSESPLLNRVGTSSAFQVHPSQFTRPSSPGLSPPQSPNLTITPLIPNQSLMIMTATTEFLARLMPSVSERELYRMEMEFLVFMEHGVQVQKIEEAEAWKEIYVMQGKIRLKREYDQDRDYDYDYDLGLDYDHNHNDKKMKAIKLEPEEEEKKIDMVLVKTEPEQEDEGIGQYETDDATESKLGLRVR